MELFKRFDLQDESDFSMESLQEMKNWLVDFWNFNPDEDMSDNEHDEMIQEILAADEKELYERMAGVGYCFEKVKAC